MKVVLSIAGSDSSGGAGIQADIRAIEVQGCHAVTAITAITAQSPKQVRQIFPVPAVQLQAQLDSLADVEISAIKTGMLGTADLVDVVAAFLEAHSTVPVVVDPVRVSSSGHRLLDVEGELRMRTKLLPLADVLTPNIPEAEVLLGASIQTLSQAEEAARALARLGASSVVLKGGHLSTDPIVDLLWDGEALHRFTCPRESRGTAHGTGCVQSATLAALLALGRSLPDSVAQTQRQLARGIAAARYIGGGCLVEPLA